MTKMKVTDDPVRRIGAIMHNARLVCHISRKELAALLNISPTELATYERGKTLVPPDVLEHVFVMGYKMIRFRTMECMYRQQRRIFKKLKQTVAEAA